MFPKFYANNLPNYVCSKRSWMNPTIFSDWLNQWSRNLFAAAGKFSFYLIIVQPINPWEIFRILCSPFCQKNSTGLLKLMDIGIILALRAHFNRLKFDKILEMIEGDGSVYECYKKWTLMMGLLSLTRHGKRPVRKLYITVSNTSRGKKY